VFNQDVNSNCIMLFCFGKSMTENVNRSCLRGVLFYISVHCFVHSSTTIVGLGLFIVEVSGLQSDKHTHILSVEHLWMSDHPDPETSAWQNTTRETNIHIPGRIQTRNPSKRAATDPQLIPRDFWDRPNFGTDDGKSP
jgi:hypothetical protein